MMNDDRFFCESFHAVNEICFPDLFMILPDWRLFVNAC